MNLEEALSRTSPTETPYKAHGPIVNFKLLEPNAKVPTRAYDTDAGYDLYSTHNEVIAPGEIKNIAIGIAMEAPKGYYFTIDGRSSLYKRGLMPLRGILDAGYQGPWFVAIFNAGKEPYEIKAGERAAQAILHKCETFVIKAVKEFEPTPRGTKGFGSSGR